MDYFWHRANQARYRAKLIEKMSQLDKDSREYRELEFKLELLDQTQEN